MKKIAKKLLASLLVIASSALAFGMASWPPTIVGTWQGVAGQTTLKLVITSQGTVGECKTITGTLANVPSGGESNIQGFYCPDTGRLTFARKDIHSNGTFQFYSANLADIGPELRMAGTFAEVSFIGHLGEYGFALEKRE
jgi:hypothetical protein